MLKAIKIRIYPNIDQIIYINKLLGSCRFIYNNLLAYKIEEYNKNKYSVSWGELGKYLTNLKQKEEYSWLNEMHSKVIAQSLIDLNSAYYNFFIKKTGFPKFKSKKDNKQSCRFPYNGISKKAFKGNRITLIKKLKNIHFKCSIKDEKYLNKNRKNIKSATLTKTKSNKYFLSILIDKEITKILPKSINDIIGIDLGIKDFIIDSNGNKFENIKIKKNNEKKLKRLHKQLSRKVKGSKNKNKARIKLAKAYEKLNNKKENYLHQVTNKLLNENQVIVMEDLSISNMLKNHKLAKSIQELSLYEFKRKLIYKANWYGRQIIEINKFYPSSKLCNCCNYKNNDIELNDRTWTCPNCNTIHDRDINAAVNILNEGKRILNIKENKLNNKIRLSSPEFKLVDYPTMDDKIEISLKSSDRKKQEKNVINKKFYRTINFRTRRTNENIK